MTSLLVYGGRGRWLILASLLVLPSAATGQRIAPGTLCEVTGDGVNLRSDARVASTSLGKVHEGELVTVLGATMEWYRITPPESFDAWISSRYVSSDGRITGTSVNVRTQPGTDAAIIGQVSKPAQVEVRGSQGEWRRIACPEGLGVWIHGKFLQPTDARRSPAILADAGGGGGAASSDPGIVLGASTIEAPDVVELVRRADLIYEAAIAGGREYADLNPARAIYLQAQTQARAPSTRHHIDLRLTEIGLRGELGERARETTGALAGSLEELETENARMRSEYAQRLGELESEVRRLQSSSGSTSAASGTPDASSFTAVGWSWPMGKVWRRPGTHRLVVGGRTLYYLNSPNVDLNDDSLWKRYMGVTGQVRVVPGWDHPIIDVESVQVIDPAPTTARR